MLRFILSALIGVASVCAMVFADAKANPTHELSEAGHLLMFGIGLAIFGGIPFLFSFLVFPYKRKQKTVAWENVGDEDNVYAGEDVGIQFHNEGDHCTGCPDSEVEPNEGVVCNYEDHCPNCPQAEIHLS